MAKVYFREGPKVGREGNEVYYIRNGSNIAQRLSIFSRVKATDKNILPKARYCHALKAYQLGKLGFENCFEGTVYSQFLKHNLSYIPPYTQDFFRDSRYPPVADFVMSRGSLGTLEIGIPKYGQKISGVIIKARSLPASNIKGKDVSTALKATYNWLEEGDIIKMFCYYYVNVTADDTVDRFLHPFIVPSSMNLRIEKFSREFTINFSDDQLMSHYGLAVTPFTTLDDYCALCLLERNTMSFPHPVHAKEAPFIGAFTATARRKTATGITCTTQSIYGNDQFNLAKDTLYDDKWTETCIADWKKKFKYFKMHF